MIIKQLIESEREMFEKMLLKLTMKYNVFFREQSTILE
jgi:hypothetical protein